MLQLFCCFWLFCLVPDLRSAIAEKASATPKQAVTTNRIPDSGLSEKPVGNPSSVRTNAGYLNRNPTPAGLRMELGIDVLAAQQFGILKGKRVGLITNPTGVNREGRSTIEILKNAPGVNLVALFAPEHGIDGTIKAGDPVSETVHPATGLPVFSLYGKTRVPTRAMLKGLDVLVYDLQDVGCRSYTFISTMGLAMQACGAARVEFVVLDRPNPVGGLRVEGPTLNPRFKSFIGQWPIPYSYGMTCGELARMIQGERWITNTCKLTVIKMKGWSRTMSWKETGLKWIPPSPKIQTSQTPLYYASTGMLGEIGGVQIGMRFGRPFETVTAPWLNAKIFSQKMNSYGLPGVLFVPFTTNLNQFVQQGARIVFTNPSKAPLTAINFYVLETVKSLAGRDLFAEALKDGRDFTMFDKANGTDSTRKDLQKNRSAKRIVQSWEKGEKQFTQARRPYLLY